MSNTNSDWHFNEPERVSVFEIGDTIEMLYIETSNIQLSVYPPRPPERKVFKVIYSCVDGKWNKSDKIYGDIMPALEETYIFDFKKQ